MVLIVVTRITTRRSPQRYSEITRRVTLTPPAMNGLIETIALLGLVVLLAALVVICVLAGAVLTVDTASRLNLDDDLVFENTADCPSTSTAWCPRQPPSAVTHTASTASIWTDDEP